MLVRVFTLGFDPATERFEDAPVQDFISDKEVESISDHFFVRDGMPYLALGVCYRTPTSAPQTASTPRWSMRSAGILKKSQGT